MRVSSSATAFGFVAGPVLAYPRREVVGGVLIVMEAAQGLAQQKSDNGIFIYVILIRAGGWHSHDGIEFISDFIRRYEPNIRRCVPGGTGDSISSSTVRLLAVRFG